MCISDTLYLIYFHYKVQIFICSGPTVFYSFFNFLVAGYMPGRTKMSCEYRYSRTLAEEIHRGRWTEIEDFVCFFPLNFNI